MLCVLESREEREERNDRCRFHMSMKLEKTDVSDARSRRGCGVSNEAMMGVRNNFDRDFSVPFSNHECGEDAQSTPGQDHRHTLFRSRRIPE